MRILFAGASVAALALLGGCAIERAIAVDECTDFFERSRDRQMNNDTIKAACTCAVEREAAGQTPIASVPPRPNPGLPEYRRHLPDCIQANGGSASGVAARESSGHAPRPTLFDPATGTSADPPGEVMPGPAEGGEAAGQPPAGTLPGFTPPPAARSGGGRRHEADRAIENANRAADEVNRELENAMRSIEGR